MLNPPASSSSDQSICELPVTMRLYANREVVLVSNEYHIETTEPKMPKRQTTMIVRNWGAEEG